MNIIIFRSILQSRTLHTGTINNFSNSIYIFEKHNFTSRNSIRRCAERDETVPLYIEHTLFFLSLVSVLVMWCLWRYFESTKLTERKHKQPSIRDKWSIGIKCSKVNAVIQALTTRLLPNQVGRLITLYYTVLKWCIFLNLEFSWRFLFFFKYIR